MDKWIRAGAAVVGILVVGGIGLALTVGRQGFSPNSTSSDQATVNNAGPTAPDFTGIVAWDNSPPLTISALRGKVVLVDFWTYSCINCQRTLPYVRQWWDKYKAQGLVIVGVHSPEFDFEKDQANIRKAIADYGVTWPVAVDSNMATWNAYGNQYWPAEYLIDKQGHIRHTHFGEGEYAVTEKAIQQLLLDNGQAVSGTLASADPGIGPDAARETTETYAGSDRGDGSVKLHGAWVVKPQWAEHTAASALGSDDAELAYQARRVFVVAGSAGAAVTVRVTIDGRDPTPAEVGSAVHFDKAGHALVTVDHHDLYAVIAKPDFARHTIRISPDGAGFQLFTFTFGS